MKTTDWNRISSKLAGIYAYRNKVNGKYYIGQSVCLRNRLKQHLSRSRNNYDSNIALHRAWKKYGLGNFELIILESFIPDIPQEKLIKKLDDLEKYYIKKYNSYGISGYNCTYGGDYGVLGLKHREEVKERLSKMQIYPVFFLNIHTGEVKSFRNKAQAAKVLNVSKTSIRSAIKTSYILDYTYLVGTDADKLQELYESRKDKFKDTNINKGNYRPVMEIKLYLKEEDGTEYLDGTYTAKELSAILGYSVQTIYEWLRNPKKYKNNKYKARLQKV